MSQPPNNDVPQYQPAEGFPTQNGASQQQNDSNQKNKKKTGCVKPALIALAVLIVLAVMASCLGGCNKEQNSPQTSQSEPAQPDNSSPQNAAPSDTKTDQSQDKPSEKPPASSKKVSPEFSAALATAQTYSDTMHMSKKGLYRQLTSDSGEKFPPDAAKYAVDNVKADWNENALQTAKNYRESMNMSKEAIRDQLTSTSGEQFTKSEADYAISHLD